MNRENNIHSPGSLSLVARKTPIKEKESNHISNSSNNNSNIKSNKLKIINSPENNHIFFKDNSMETNKSYPSFKIVKLPKNDKKEDLNVKLDLKENDICINNNDNSFHSNKNNVDIKYNSNDSKKRLNKLKSLISLNIKNKSKKEKYAIIADKLNKEFKKKRKYVKKNKIIEINLLNTSDSIVDNNSVFNSNAKSSNILSASTLLKKKLKKRNSIHNKDKINNISNQTSSLNLDNLTSTNKKNTNGNKAKEIIFPIKKRLYYSTISGEPINNSSEYEDSENSLNETYEFKKEVQTIFDFLDICDREKKMFCLWNEYINKLNNYKDLGSLISMFNKVKNFINITFEKIKSEKLVENLSLFLIILFDSGKINKNELKELNDLIYNKNK